MEIVVTYENPNSEDSIQDNIVAEPIAEYRPTEKSPYAGTSINNYYACPTNKEKVSVLQWIVENPEFQVLKRYSTAENAVYGLNISQYDDRITNYTMWKAKPLTAKIPSTI